MVSLYLKVVIVVICASCGAICLYDHSVLLKVLVIVAVGILIRRMVHLSAFLPSLVTMDNSPPLSMYHCILVLSCSMLSACVYHELSSQ